MTEKKKHAGGRPPKFTRAEEMQAKIDAYFAKCEQREEPKTMAGLALALDLSRQGLCEYAEKGEFSDTVKKARRTVESEVEIRLLAGGNAAGAIFWLKNNSDYRDKQEVKHSGVLTLEQLVSGSSDEE